MQRTQDDQPSITRMGLSCLAFRLRSSADSLTIPAMGQNLMRLLSAKGGQASLLMVAKHVVVFLFFFLLPTQLAKHFWPQWTYIQGIRIDYLSPTLGLIDIIALLVIASHGYEFVQYIRTAKRTHLAILGLLIGTNIIFSSLPLRSIFSWFHILLGFAAMIPMAKNVQKYLFPILAGLAAGSLIQLMLVGAQFANQSSIQGIWYWLGERRIVLSLPDVAKIAVYGREYLRPYGTFSHPNTLGGFYLLVFFFVHWLKNRFHLGKHSVLADALMVVSPFLILISFSKVAIFGFVVGNIILIWSDFTYRKCWLCLLARSSVLVVLLLLFTIPVGDPYSLQKRLALVSSSLRIFVDHSLWGVGLGNYTIAQSLIQIPPRFAPLLQPVHNIFLLMLTEIGVGGTMGLFYLMRQLRIVVPMSLQLVPIFVAVFVTGFFDHYWITQTQTQMLLVFVVLNILLMGPTMRNEHKERPL